MTRSIKISPVDLDKGKLRTSAGEFFPRYVLLRRRESLLSINTKESSKLRPKTRFFRRVKGIENLPRRGGVATLLILTAAAKFRYLADFTKFYKFGGYLLLLKIIKMFRPSSIAGGEALGVAF